MSGYVITREGADALNAFEDERVRFAASLEDGSGFIAFNGEDSNGLAELGQVYRELQALWPIRMIPPKRSVGTGREVFSLISNTFGDYLSQQESVTGLCAVTDTLLLVESDGPISAGPDWSSAVVEFKDKRVPATV